MHETKFDEENIVATRATKILYSNFLSESGHEIVEIKE